MSYKLLVFLFIFTSVNICTKIVNGEHFSTSIEFKEDEGKKFEKVEASDLDWETLKQLVSSKIIQVTDLLYNCLKKMHFIFKIGQR